MSVWYGSNDTYVYLAFYSSDLEHSPTYYCCCCCVLYATPHYTRSIIPHYLLPIYKYMYGLRGSTAAAVIGHHMPHARWLGAGRR